MYRTTTLTEVVTGGQPGKNLVAIFADDKTICKAVAVDQTNSNLELH